MPTPCEPPRHCPLCPRLFDYRSQNQAQHPDWWNGPAPSFGDPVARLLIVGLAPGKSGANRTGRPFTGDHAGILLYQTLIKTGFADGTYGARPDDDLRLIDCMVTNAVRCAPPGNKPTPAEEATCRPFLTARIEALPQLEVIIALGEVARRNVWRALGGKPGPAIGHAGEADVGGFHLISSYHCSRLNTQTGRLTPQMFERVFKRARALLGAQKAIG